VKRDFLIGEMTMNYARLNLKVRKEAATSINIERWQKILYDAAVWGETDDAEVFFSDSELVMGVSVPYEDNGLGLLEAGMTLGFCQRIKEENGGDIFEHSWQSLHTEDGTTIESTM
jgi:hypothetical protein